MTGMRRVNMFIIALVVLFSVPHAADALDMRKEKLADGLTVVHVERHELPIVTVSLLIKASPLQEIKPGSAYLTAKSLLDGTARRKAVDISHEIDYIGGSIETSVNEDFTIISFSVLKKDVKTGFDIFSDILVHPSFSVREVERRKTLLAGSLKKMEEDPSYVAGREFLKQVFGPFPYGRPVEGGIESIGKLTRYDLVAFYDKWYRPDNAILVVTGDLGKEELAGLIKQYLSPWKKVVEWDASVAFTPPAQGGKLKQRQEIIDMDVSQANIVMGHAGVSRSNPDYYAVQVMNYILGGGGFASRLMRIIRDEKGLTYSIHSSFSANKYPGRFEIEVQTKNESAGLVINETMKQIRRMMTDGATQQELSDAKDFLIGSFPRRIETGRKIAAFITAVQFFELGDDFIERYKDHISKVTKEDVLRVARKYLKDEDMIIVIVGNKKKLKL